MAKSDATVKTSRRLTKKEEDFCRGLAAGLDGANAWRNAYVGGRKVKYANINACQVSKRAHVIARLAELRKPDEKRLFLTIARKREILHEIAESKSSTSIDRQRSIDLDNRMTGVYTSKVEVTGEITLGSVLEALATQPALPDPGEVYELTAGMVENVAGVSLPEEAGPGQSSTPGPFADDEGTELPPIAKKGLKTGLVKRKGRVYSD